MTAKFKDLHKQFMDLELEVDGSKLDTIVRFLTHCTIKGILKKNSPQLVFLIREAMEFSQKDK